MRRALLVGLSCLAACSSPSAGQVLAVDQAGFRVPVPDGWDARATDPADWADGHTVALLATQALNPPCEPDACSAPVASLRESALLMWWQSTTCAGTACEPPDGERLLVGGRQAARANGSHLCDALGATAEDAYVVSVSPQRLDVIVVCERHATDAERAAMRDVLERVSWHTP
jgi:hypothetical protein